MARPKKNITTDEAIAIAEKKITECTTEIKACKKELRILAKRKAKEDAANQELETQANLLKIAEFIKKSGKAADEILAELEK